MLFSHSIKAMFNNFALIYKVLIYKIIAFVLSASVALTFSYSSFVTLAKTNVFQNFLDVFKTADIRHFLIGIRNSVVNMFNVAATLDKKTLVIIIIACIVFVVLISFLFNLDKIAQTEVVSARLSSNCKLSYTGCFFKRLGYAIKFTFARFIYTVVFNAIIFSVLIAASNLLDISGFFGIISPFIIFLILGILLTLQYTIFGSHAASCVVNDGSVVKNLFSSIAINFRAFFKFLSYNFCLIVFTVFINYLFSSIFAGVFLILSLPVSIVFITVMQTVLYFDGNGSRYYLDKDTIITPNKNEFYDKVKNIIDLI